MKARSKPGRPRGSSGSTRREREDKILDALAGHVMRHKRLPALAGIAEIAGVSVATLVHYFQSRQGVCAAVLRRFGETGRRFYLPKTREPAGPAPDSIRDVCSYVADAMAGPVHSIHEFGFVEGLHDSTLAREYLVEVLDATLDAVAARIAEHARRGEFQVADPRLDAVQLVGPVVLAGLHQNALGGAALCTVDLHRLAAESADAYLAKKLLAPETLPGNK